VILAKSGMIEPADLQLSYAQDTAPVAAPPAGASLNLDAVEKETIAAALRKHGFNISHAARELGLTRASLYRRMEKHGL
jgi:transcriptional regulator of acetoin/glycerol metabolism